MAEKYRPSSGTEGEVFKSQWCYRCARFDKDDPCMIEGATFFLGIDHPEYPSEWIVDENGPRCTAFEKPGAPKPDRCPDTIDLFPEAVHG